MRRIGILFLVGVCILLVIRFNSRDKEKEKENSYVEEEVKEEIYTYPHRINFAKVKEAPFLMGVDSPKETNSDINILAHWYNDFGLEYTASAKNQANGSYTWYDWSWNHTGNPNYDPSRHPLLGWYKGDDTNVLDWQSYWLAKYGVTGTILTGVINKENYYKPNDKMYWTNVLFNKVKNFNNLQYVLWLDSKSPKQQANSQQDFIIDHIIKIHRNIYVYNVNGKKYPVFFVWDMEAFRGVYDNYNGSKISQTRLIYLSKRMQELGYDGICILGRNLVISSTSYSTKQITDLKEDGVYLFRGSYSYLYGKGYGDSYEKYAKTAAFPDEKNNVINVVTSAESQYPHPSKWKIRGSKPELFETALERAVSNVKQYDLPKIITVYNVSEWAEGGPGLQPNKRDGYGYLEAVKRVLEKNK